MTGAYAAILAALSSMRHAPGASAHAQSYDGGSRPTFDRVATERARGAHVNFVWLDIKNPDFCDGSSPQRTHCSVAGLRGLARRKLENQGVRVLYGFDTSNVGDVGWKAVADGLRAKEGVAVSGTYRNVRTAFDTLGSGIPPRQRVMDDGPFTPSLHFASIARQLRLGVQARDRGELAGVFGWTLSGSEGPAGAVHQVDTFLGSPGTGADGLIYGHTASCYPDGVRALRAAGGTTPARGRPCATSPTGCRPTAPPTTSPPTAISPSGTDRSSQVSVG